MRIQFQAYLSLGIVYRKPQESLRTASQKEEKENAVDYYKIYNKEDIARGRQVLPFV